MSLKLTHKSEHGNFRIISIWVCKENQKHGDEKKSCVGKEEPNKVHLKQLTKSFLFTLGLQQHIFVAYIEPLRVITLQH